MVSSESSALMSVTVAAFSARCKSVHAGLLSQLWADPSLEKFGSTEISRLLLQSQKDLLLVRGNTQQCSSSSKCNCCEGRCPLLSSGLCFLLSTSSAAWAVSQRFVGVLQSVFLRIFFLKKCLVLVLSWIFFVLSFQVL